MDKNVIKRFASEIMQTNSHLKSMNYFIENGFKESNTNMLSNHTAMITHATYQNTQLNNVYSAIKNTNKLLLGLVPNAIEPVEGETAKYNLNTGFTTHFENQTKLYDLLTTKFQADEDMSVNTNSTIDFGKGLNNLGTGLQELGAGIWLLGINSFKVLPFISYIDSTAENVANSVDIYISTFSNANSGEFKTIAENIGVLGTGVLEYTLSSFKAAPLLAYNKKTVDSIGNVIDTLRDTFSENKKDGISIKTVTKELKGLSGGIVAFGTALALSTPLYLIGAPGLAMAGLSITAFMAAARFSGVEDSKGISKNLLFLAGGVLAFGGSLALLSTFEYDVNDLLIIGTSLLGFGGAMVLLDNYKGAIIKGSLTLGVMSLSLLAFSYSLSESQKLFNGDWSEFGNDVGMIAAGIGSMALTFGLLSMASGYLVPGMFALGGMALSLYVFSKSMEEASNIWGGDWNKFGNDVGMLAIGITSLTAIFTGLTVALPFIAPGMLALGGISASLYAFAYSITQFDGLNINADLGKNIGNLLTGIHSGLTTLSVGEYLMLSGIIVPLTSLGLGLKSVAYGVKSFSDLNTDLDFDKIGADVTALIGGVQGIFEKIGASGNEGTSLMKLVTGGDFKESNFEQGVESVRNIGDTLNSLAEGVIAWADIKKKYPGLDVNVIATNISDVLGITYGVFEKIGNTEDANTSFMKLMLGNDLGTTAVQRGIISTKQLGDVLTTLATGVSSWASLETKLPNFNAETIANNIRTVLETINVVFAKIGNSESGQGGSLLKRLTGADFGKTAVERGILAVKDSGTILDTLATGIIKWNSLTNMKDENGNPIAFNRDTIMSNIQSVLTILPDLFKQIGEDTEGGGWFKSIDSDITRGLETTKKFGVALSSIQKPITDLDQLKSPKSKIYDLAKGYERISLAIRKIPNTKLSLLTDLMIKHKDVLDTEPNNDKTLIELVEKLNELIESTQKVPTTLPNNNNGVVTKEVNNNKQTTTSELKSDEMVSLLKNIYILLNSEMLVVKNKTEF